MNLEALRDYCLLKKNVTEEMPFDKDTLVFKVWGKMFLLTNIREFESMNVKCDPEEAIALREMYPSVLPGYHMNKKHWNTILFNTGSIPESLFYEWIDKSYELVIKGLPKRYSMR